MNKQEILRLIEILKDDCLVQENSLEFNNDLKWNPYNKNNWSEMVESINLIEEYVNEN